MVSVGPGEAGSIPAGIGSQRWFAGEPQATTRKEWWVSAGRVGRPCTHISPEQKVSESSFSLPSTAQAVHVDGLCYNIFNINRSVI
ncbi:MAG: hypothetical protein A2566_00485 [Candidatus Zambryskibacteria bacterium RIFOXYD1_FULL_40_13]|nr:MAG: hypothetical protein UU06_C0020G0003 [Parcubacteria group bacterium GW2011_GWB1_40_5]KKR68696.1 MAG: hypothetical protein UU11_C0007G0014 [Parcubacteria group bacterium GW2011_GWF2_40_69]KKR80078.1 MAG: hypothetical protein UU27_C0039G0006 [Parcubacteria group bacterium GW2011_GWD1_40_9]OHB16029.1 MAG: hypothetical protein A2566_00485 [Candidatus Zambryskibacteria bacterium RIFOXYD1_FULL_40_13]HBD24991.1 hypothetical protein [Candidatus Zambryskibacteria bacterium]